MNKLPNIVAFILDERFSTTEIDLLHPLRLRSEIELHMAKETS